MRPFELLFIAWIAVCITVCARLPAARIAGWTTFVIAILACCGQLALEGFRWQLSFAFVALILLLIALVCGSFSRTNNPLNSEANEAKNSNKFGRYWQWTSSLLFLSAVLAVLVPIANLPAPDGPYSVGTLTYHLTDPKRLERLVETGKPRELMIQVWYPSVKVPDSKNAPYMPVFSDWSPFRTATLFSIAASHLHLIRTHSSLATPVFGSANRYPVLIFSHGMMGGRFQNTVLAEDLASHGYVVVGIDHTYDCSFAILPERTIGSLLLTKSPPPLAVLTGLGLDSRVRDVSFVLNELSKLNAADPNQILSNHLDLDRVGIYGHSLGGQTALLSCVFDKRIKAGLSMDGVILVSGSISQPFMVMQAEREGDQLQVGELCKRLHGPHFVLTLKNSGHANFTDLPLLTPLHWVLCLSGSIDGLRATQIVDDYALAFFDQFIKRVDVSRLQNKLSFPEVEFQSWPKSNSLKNEDTR